MIAALTTSTYLSCINRKGRELWVEPDYRDRLVWVLTAEVACAYQYQLNEGARNQGGRASDGT